MTVRSKSTFQTFWKSPEVLPHFRSGVSLHSHTMYSEESLAMVPHYTAGIPILGRAIEQQINHYNAKNQKQFNFADAFWTPPLSPYQAYRVEEKQIRRRFNLPALISLTDHDDLRAASQLRILDRFKNIPVSVEWTIPFEGTFFHLGVHNLPPSDSEFLMQQFAAFTACPTPHQLAHLLALLDAMPEVLLVLNHPLWDEKGIGTHLHTGAVKSFLTQYGSFIHALELNGLRCWRENKQVIALAAELNLPVVAGGDRHGREPNAILNLSRASTFPEFVAEIRRERQGHVVFLPQYHESAKVRVLQTMVDIFREYPENVVGRRFWADRVYFRNPQTRVTTPLSEFWPDGGPAIAKQFIAFMRLLELAPLRTASRRRLLSPLSFSVILTSAWPQWSSTERKSAKRFSQS